MKHPHEIQNPALEEVLCAIGLLLLEDAQGNPDRVDAIFSAIVPVFAGRYPHHKLLSHLCDAARQGTVENFIAGHRGLEDEVVR